MLYMSKEPDAVGYVYSALDNHYYECPNIEAVDKHLRELLSPTVLGSRSNLAEGRKACLWLDVDRLLMRRLYLQVLAGQILGKAS